MQVPVELKRIYLDRRRKDIHRLRSHLERGDFSLAMKLGHQLKGNAKTFEYPEMASHGGNLELAALEGNEPRIETLLRELEEYLTQKRGELERQDSPARFSEESIPTRPNGLELAKD